MNAIVPRQTIEQIVAHRNAAIDLYEVAFEKIREAHEAIQAAADRWELAAPGKPSRVYDSSQEVKAFNDAVTLPDHTQYMRTARRLIDITVWEHVIRMTKIESLMDSAAVAELEKQMQHKEPRYGTIERAVDMIERSLNAFLESDEEHRYRWDEPNRFVRELKDIAHDFESVCVVNDDMMAKLTTCGNAMINALKKETEAPDRWIEDILSSLETIERERHVQRGLPPVSVKNIQATVESLIGQSHEIFQRSVVNTFTKLDRRFRSHDGFKIGNRVIFERCFNDWGGWNGYGSGSSQQRLMDIERIFLVLDRKNRVSDDPEGSHGRLMDPASIVWHIDQKRSHERAQSEIESAFFKVRIFKNGNMHLWMTRKDLLVQVNRILAGYYGAQVGDQMNDGVDEDPLENRKTAPAKYFGFFPTPPAVAEEVWNKIRPFDYRDTTPLVLEPSAGTGNLAAEAINRGWDTDCIEMQPHLAAQLENQGHRRVTCADFLTIEPNPIYDLVVMNPPFDRERDIDHVTHALKFLKPDGRLVAVMSSGTEWRTTKKSKAFQALMERMKAKWTDLPAGAFSEQGTNVNTVIVSVYKDGRAQNRW